MHAYIFGKVVTTTAFCIFSVVITTAPHWRLLVLIIIDSLCVFSVVTTTGFRQAPWCTPGVSTSRWSATTCRDQSDRTGSHPCIMYIFDEVIIITGC
jgi:hypothetical protein